MLSRVADRIFWMSRQMERAENTARILGVTSNLVLFGTADVHEQNLLATLSITGTEDAYLEHHEKLTLPALIEFMALDGKNPSSIYSCLKWARENAHAVRGEITSEMWETLNATWLELRGMKHGHVTGAGATQFFDWVKDRSHLFRGVTYGTIVRGEAFNFSRLGTFLERADNTARILDVKYHVLLPSVEDVGGAVDYYQWAAVLRSVSSFEAYRKVYRDVITPVKVAELLILRQDMPRSLHACMDEAYEIFQMIATRYSGEALRRAGELHAALHFGRMDVIFDHGLHEYLTDFLGRLTELGSEVDRSFFNVAYA